jgi:hypothetical protein
MSRAANVAIGLNVREATPCYQESAKLQTVKWVILAKVTPRRTNQQQHQLQK